MTLVRWEPFQNLFNMQQRMAQPFFGSDDAYGSWAPPVDIFEREDDLIIRAEIPGVAREEIDVEVENNTLVLRGERTREKEGDEENAYRLERSYGSFMRSFRLPKTVDATRIAATYRDGVLEVTLPKAEEAKPKKIAIQVS